MSLRYNKFNNKGVCSEFEVLGNWMGRVSVWVLGLADKLFRGDQCPAKQAKEIAWRTGKRIVYANDIDEESVPEWLPSGDDGTSDTDDFSDYNMDCSDSEDDAYICAQTSSETLPFVTPSPCEPCGSRKSARKRCLDTTIDDNYN